MARPPSTRTTSLRPRGSDDLGLRRALSDRLLPLLVAAMVFLAALTCGGVVAAARLAAHWRGGAAALVTVQVPRPDSPSPIGSAQRGDAVGALLAGASGPPARRLSTAEVAALTQPWLGYDATRLSLLLPAVFELHTATLPGDLPERLERVAPGTLVERDQLWFARLAILAGSLRALAALLLAVVAFVAAAMVAIAARAGLAARRDAIEIVHGLGGTDGMIAGQFAGRITLLTVIGAILGSALSVPVLAGLANLAEPFQAAGDPVVPATQLGALPKTLWIALPTLPVLAGCIGWITTQLTVRLWLGRLP